MNWVSRFLWVASDLATIPVQGRTQGNRHLEGIASDQRELGGISKLVVASNDDHLPPFLKKAVMSLGVEVLSLADLYVPVVLPH